MKTLICTLKTFVALAAVLAMPHVASAAKSFASMSALPTSTNITAGVAASVSTTITLVDGNGGSSLGNGSNCFYSVSVSPADPTVTTSLSVTNFTSLKNFPQTPTTVMVATTSLTPSNTYTVTIWANNNPSNSTSITPISTTFTISMATIVFNPIMVWSPAGVNTNWSTAGNWSQSGPPGLANDVIFNDTGIVGTAGQVDNVVDSSLTIGSLTYGNTNNYHTTLIASGKTLTVVDVNGLSAGTGTDNGPSQTSINTITNAGGTLIVSNVNASVNIGQANVASGTAEATLDMSGLGRFQATISRLLVGVDSVIKGDNGALNLARTNIITTTVGSASPQIDIGESSQSGATTAFEPIILLLGQTNACFADSIAVGRGRIENSSMLFNANFLNPTAYFRGTNGITSRVGTWSVGDGFNGKLGQCHGTNDFSLGTVDALVNTMNIGAGSTTAGSTPTPGTGTLIVNAGTINVNSMNVGVSTIGAGTGAGIVNLTGGLLVVNTNLALATGSNDSSATLNISSATVTANNGITAGIGSSTINLTGSTLSATNSTATVGTTNNPVSNFGITSSTLNLALQDGAPSVATTNLAVGGGPNTINVSSVPLLTGPAQFQVIQYGINGGISTGDLTTFVLGTLPPASPAYGGYISNNVANNSIDIVITNGLFVPVLVWDGVPNGNWNMSTPNWRPASGPDTDFTNTAFVTFDDSLTGTPNVNLTTTVIPGSLTVSNTAENYVFSGGGGISGATALVENGSGTLTLSETGGDNFSGGIVVNSGTVILDNAGSAISGGTTINGGTVQLGNNDANGGLPAGPVADNGALIFNRNDASLTVANVISGTGTLTQNGASTDILTLSGANISYAGATAVLQGTLRAGNTKAFGTNQLTGSITITNAATLDVNAQKFGAGAALPVTVSGAGVGGNGAIVNNGTNQTSVLFGVTLAANTTIGGSGNWDLRNTGGSSPTADATLNGGGFDLTKVGTNTITLTSVTVDSFLENINVQAGALDVADLTTSLGDPGATATVSTNATLVLDTLENVLSKVIVLNGGATLKGSSTNSSGGPVTFDGVVTLAGAAAMTANSGSLLLLEDTVGGSGGFSKIGAGTVFLAASNTYSGSTVVSGGTLALTNFSSIDGSIVLSTNISITPGATLDVSGRSDGTFTLAGGQTLTGGGLGTNGPGTVNGILIVSAGATLAPGASSTNSGALSASSSATLQGATVMKISAANGNDQLDAAGITYGGALLVTNFSGTVTNGQTFRLFVATNGIYNAGTFSSTNLPSAAGLTWTNNLAVNGTITTGVVTGPSPRPVITNIGLLGTNLHLNGTNGALGGMLYVLASTNLTLPFTNWTVISTNMFTGGGTFNVTVTNVVNPNVPQSFYIIQQPH